MSTEFIHQHDIQLTFGLFRFGFDDLFIGRLNIPTVDPIQTQQNGDFFICRFNWYIYSDEVIKVRGCSCRFDQFSSNFTIYHQMSKFFETKYMLCVSLSDWELLTMLRRFLLPNLENITLVKVAEPATQITQPLMSRWLIIKFNRPIMLNTILKCSCC